MIGLLLVLSAGAGTLELGVGRAAVVNLGDMRPTAVSVSHPSRLEVIPSPPHLIVVAKRTGTTSLEVEHETGTEAWSVTIDESDGMPTGDRVIAIPWLPLDLQVDEGVLWTPPHDPEGFTVVDPDGVQVELFGDDALFLQGRSPGVSDIVIERDRRPPTILSVYVSPARAEVPVGPSPARRPAGTTSAQQTLEMVAGGMTQVDVGGPVRAILVGHPSRLEVERQETSSVLTLTSTRAGETTVLADTGGGSVWMRRVVMAPASD